MGANYRADQVGSFLRPAELLEARKAGRGRALQAVEDRHIARALEKQKELGFEVFTGGELRRKNFMSEFTDAVDGFDLGDAVARSWQAEDAKKGGKAAATAVSSVTGIVTDKLRQARPLTGRELPYLKAHSPGAIKMTPPSATQFPAISLKRGIGEQAYASPSALLADIVEIMKTKWPCWQREG